MPEMTPLEIADAMKITALAAKPYKEFAWQYEAATQAESIFRKIAAGEYAPVVHGRWLNFYGDFATAECSKCGECYEVSPDDKPREEYFNAFKQCYKHCPSCGALMDEKDDGHE